MKVAFSVAIVLTLAYFCGIGLLAFLYWPESGLSLNELGDFLAGTLSPVAIFWVILGFFQQGKELNQSVRALELQAEELRNSVQQQARLVSITEMQHEAEITARQEAIAEQERLRREQVKPVFSMKFSGGAGSSGTLTKSYTLRNSGALAQNIFLRISTADLTIEPNAWPNLDVGEHVNFSLKGPSAAFQSAVLVTVESVDSVFGQALVQNFEVSGKTVTAIHSNR